LVPAAPAFGKRPRTLHVSPTGTQRPDSTRRPWSGGFDSHCDPLPPPPSPDDAEHGCRCRCRCRCACVCVGVSVCRGRGTGGQHGPPVSHQHESTGRTPSVSLSLSLSLPLSPSLQERVRVPSPPGGGIVHPRAIPNHGVTGWIPHQRPRWLTPVTTCVTVFGRRCFRGSSVARGPRPSLRAPAFPAHLGVEHAPPFHLPS